MKIGYARVSTKEQNIDMQIAALKKEGCEEIFEDKGASGTQAERIGLTQAIKTLRKGDIFVVWKLDRAFRSLKHMIELINNLNSKGVEFKSLNDSIDTSSAGGRLVFHIMASIAEFERDLISDRTKAGLEAARARGRFGGRKKKISDNEFKKYAKYYDNHELPVTEIIKMAGISRMTFYRRYNAIRNDK